ncbi:hypothetical protein ACHHYP_15847 [Achlya hypogyna]|uniref:Uncharacterized protein n=1 Tax=Achlya hypogyna TaxID=1202772 RepID=A0A1V9YA17_ACHHY|nr:hypothetical protein ACHHYP_15847 [Achlya hypogyna]
MTVVPESLLLFTLAFGAYAAMCGLRFISHMALILLLLEYFFLLTVSEVAAIAAVIVLTGLLGIGHARRVLRQWVYTGMRAVLCAGGILGLGLFLYFALGETLDAGLAVGVGLTTMVFVALFACCDDRVSFIVTTACLGTALMMTAVALWDNDHLVFAVWHLPLALFLLVLGAGTQWHFAKVAAVPDVAVLWLTPRASDATEPATPTPKHLGDEHHIV